MAQTLSRGLTLDPQRCPGPVVAIWVIVLGLNAGLDNLNMWRLQVHGEVVKSGRR